MDVEREQLWGLEPLLTVEDLAAYLGVPRQTIYDWRVRGLGPRAHRVGKRLRFAAGDVRSWMQGLGDGAPPAGPAGTGGG